VPLVRQGKAASVALHVRVSLEAEIGGDASAFDQAGEAGRGERRTPL